METLFVIGRVLFGGFFLMNAYNHLLKPAGLSAYAESKGVPMAKTAVVGSGVLLLVGAMSIITGLYVQVGIGALALFLVPTSFMIHPFWKYEGQERMGEMTQFMKNIALLGAVLMFVAIPLPWAATLGGF